MELSEEEQMQQAIAMSMGQNPEMMSEILGNLPGVNPEDPRIKNAVKDEKKPDDKSSSAKKGSPKK